MLEGLFGQVGVAVDPVHRLERLRFLDYLYLYLGFTNATAFSPTDVMPLAPWAKIVMSVQALLSLLILGLVVARAVNVLA
ncbi:hypothetical protein ACE1OA_34760 [Streptomyces sp. JL2001]|uniref:hypothetical protein n=1 Tax=Streptomyces sp. JL2001 TaxID=3342488 RepID=UPI003D809309